jgi:seryl-tRNA synthetase
MPLLDVLDVLRHRASRRHESAAETLWAAAKRIAAGETADPTAVEAALAETGTSLDGFNELVELARTRRRLFAKLDQATPARVKLDKLNASTAAEREAFEDTRRRWLERAAVLGDEISALERIVQAGNEARDALCQPENLPATVAEKVEAAIESHGAALVQLDALQRELNRQREIRDRRTWMAAQKRESGKCHPLDIDDDERLAKRAVNQIAELEPQLREAQAAVHAAETHIASCRAAALKA